MDFQNNRDMIPAFPACDHDVIAPATMESACDGHGLETVTAAA
jgi:hypothetical protein